MMIWLSFPESFLESLHHFWSFTNVKAPLMNTNGVLFCLRSICSNRSGQSFSLFKVCAVMRHFHHFYRFCFNLTLRRCPSSLGIINCTSFVDVSHFGYQLLHSDFTFAIAGWSVNLHLRLKAFLARAFDRLQPFFHFVMLE